MERLNDILGRNAQRRQHPSEQRPPQGQAVQRPSQVPPPAGGRRPMPEQTARLGQQGPPSYAPYSQHHEAPAPYSTRPRTSQERALTEADPHDQYSYDTPNAGGRTVYNRQQRPPMNSAASYAQRSRSLEEMQPHTPRPLSAPSERPYRQSDAYPPVPADVVEEWEDESDLEESTTGMRYGDWEEEGNDLPPGDSEIVPASRLTRQLTPRELPAPGKRTITGTHPGAEGRDMRDLRNVTRTLREVPEVREMRNPLASGAHPPLPQAHTQEMQRAQRNTQPLNPHTMMGVNRAHAPLPQEAQPPQRALRQSTSREVAQPQSYSQPAISSPAPMKGLCSKCRGAGYLRIDVPFGHPNFGKPVACECKEVEKKEKRRQQLLELSDLSAFHNKGFRNFNVRFSGVHQSVMEAYQTSLEYAQNPDGWLFLIGPNGCGKTHLAAAIANQSLSSGAVVLFSVVPDLLAHLRATFAPNALEAYDQRFSKMREAELLVLDDLGAHQSSPWASEKLFQLLNYRYNSGYPTVITANKQGLNGIDERILSRLSDTALVTTVHLSGAIDYRRQNTRKESSYR